MKTKVGTNRTGLQASPVDARKLQSQNEVNAPPPPTGGGERFLTAREEIAADAEKDGVGLGTMPPPATAKGVVKTIGKALKGESATMLLDLLGARLAFERTGARLYEALLVKIAARGDGASEHRDRIEQIHAEELKHFDLVRRTIEALGGDPTAMTPAADLGGVLSLGVLQALSDPRTTAAQALEAIRVAELVDNVAWHDLVLLLRAAGEDDVATDFEAAWREEERHLADVQNWVLGGIADDLGVREQIRPELAPS